MDLQNNVRVFLICVSLSFPHNDCKVIGTTSTTATLTPATTTTPRPYPGCGVKLDFEVTGHIWKGKEVEENAYPWMAFIYSYNRDAIGIDVRRLDLPDACKQTKTAQTTKDPGGRICGGI